MFNYILGLGLFLVPLILRLTPNASTVRMSKDIFYYFIVCLLVLFYEKQKEVGLKTKLILSYFLFHCYFFTNAFAEIYFWTQFQMVSISVVFFYLLISSKINKNLIFNIISIAGLIQALWCICNFFGIEPYYEIFNLFGKKLLFERYQAGQGIGALGNTMLSGAFIALCAPSLFRPKWAYIVPIYLLGIITTNSLMSLATLVGIILYYFYSKYVQLKFLPYFGLIIVCSCFIFFGFPEYGYFTDNDRLKLWTVSLNNIHNWFIGNGLGNFPNEIPNIILMDANQSKPMHAHSEYVESIYAFGVIGIAPIVYFFYQSIKKTNNIILLSAIFGIAINCFGNFTFHIAPLAMLSLTYLSLSFGDDNV